MEIDKILDECKPVIRKITYHKSADEYEVSVRNIGMNERRSYWDKKFTTAVLKAHAYIIEQQWQQASANDILTNLRR